MLDLTFILRSMVNDLIAFQRSKDGLYYRKFYSLSGFAKEFGTIRLSTHRRAGHSSAIAELSNEFKDSIVLVPCFNQKVHLIKKGADEKRIFNFKDTSFKHFKEKLTGLTINYIFVDNSFYMSKKWENFLSEIISEFSEQNHTVGVIFIQ